MTVDIDVVYPMHLVGDDGKQLFGIEFEFQVQRLVAEYGFADVVVNPSNNRYEAYYRKIEKYFLNGRFFM